MPGIRWFTIAALLATPALPATARQTSQATVPAPPAPPYADIATLVLAAPLVIDATIRSSTQIRGAEAANVAPGTTRFYVEADVAALIRGRGGLPSRIGYLVDVPLDARGRAPRLRKQRVLLFARPVAGRPDQVQLVTPGAQRNWNDAIDTRTRGIVREVLDPAAPPAITGLGNAFHVPGTLPGEGETQIFLTTTTGDPVSLLVLRRPGEERRWSVALGDIIDESAGAPARDTLGWYRLACGLPRALPDTSLSSQEPGNAAIAREDYAFVLESLGSCDSGA